MKDICCVLSKPLDDDYVNILSWEQDSKAKTFLLEQTGGTESAEDVFVNRVPEIKNLSTLKTVCSDLSRFGYHINNIYLNTECSEFDCHFLHKINLSFSSIKKKLCVKTELLTFNDLILNHEYDYSKSTITVNDEKIQNYRFQLLNLPIQNYKTIKTKINQILLLS